MPHYKDGSPAQVGDFVRGQGYNEKNKDGSKRELAGTVVTIEPNTESCNLVVGWLENITDTPGTSQLQPVFGYWSRDGKQYWFRIRFDYGETKDFEKVSGPEIPQT